MLELHCSFCEGKIHTWPGGCPRCARPGLQPPKKTETILQIIYLDNHYGLWHTPTGRQLNEPMDNVATYCYLVVPEPFQSIHQEVFYD